MDHTENHKEMGNPAQGGPVTPDGGCLSADLLDHQQPPSGYLGVSYVSFFSPDAAAIWTRPGWWAAVRSFRSLKLLGV